MSDNERTTEPVLPHEAPPDTPPEGIVLPFPGPPPAVDFEAELPPPKPKIRWLRLLALLTGLGLLAAVSTVFGMMMAVASDLPALDVLDVAETPSFLYDRSGKVKLGTLTGNQRRILVQSADISPVMKQAIVAIEDRRFFTNSGVDVRGIGRALWQDVVSKKVVQGGSTITQQLVKNRLDAQTDRTLFQKLRESAIAFHMTRKWDKQKILQNYLNTIYFGNGAYGIESAARTYFGRQHPGCGSDGQPACASRLEPQEAALLAGVVASPNGYDPITNPGAAKARRDLVLRRMFEQGYISADQLHTAALESIPTRDDINPPAEASTYPYFTTWVRQQVVDKVGPGPAFEGGLKVRTTIDGALQEAAEKAVRAWLGDNVAPAAAMVAIDNKTSEVRAMVGGPLVPGAFNKRPFNLATQGQRQPGSAFKPFTLAEALRQGVSPDAVFASKKKLFCVTRRKGKCVEVFTVNNYEDKYAGALSLAQATAYSDNSVFAEVGIRAGTKKIAKLAGRMGIRTPVSTNPAITLGGLRQGVSVLDMAHAYETFAQDGRLTFGTMSPGYGTDSTPGPVGIQEIRRCKGGRGNLESCKTELARTLDGDKAINQHKEEKILSYDVAQKVKGILAGVVKFGSGKRAGLGDNIFVAGKTGTTEDYGDAWFVGFTKEFTVAVWMGFPDAVRSMKPPTYSFQGNPVAGGTYPAAIWNTFMKAVLAIQQQRHPKFDKGTFDSLPSAGGSTGGGPTGPAAPATSAAPEAPATGGATPKKPKQKSPEQTAPAEPNATAAPQQQSTPAPSGGEGGAAAPTPGAAAAPATTP